MKEKGFLLTFEGNECSGKTSIIPLVKEALESRGYSVKVVREPGGTEAGEDIRHIILDNFYPQAINGRTEAYLYAASRSEAVEKIIMPSLNEYDFVITDRYYYSSLVWQGMIRGLGEFVTMLNQPFIDSAAPNLAIFLDITEQTRLERMNRRSDKHDRLDNEPMELLNRIDDGYHALVEKFPEFVSVDANGTLEEVFTACMKKIEEVYCNEGYGNF